MTSRVRPLHRSPKYVTRYMRARSYEQRSRGTVPSKPHVLRYV